MVEKIAKSLKSNRLLSIFIILGVLLILFPDYFSKLVPGLLGVSLILYAFVNLAYSIKYPEADASMGDAIIKGVVGCVILLMEEKSLSVIGVIWALLSLYEVAEKVDELRKNRNIRPGKVILIIVTTLLAVMLMMDPFEHFEFHMMVLGIEMIAAALVRFKKGTVKEETEVLS